MLGAIDFDYYGYGYDSRDDEILKYLEIDEQIHEYPQETPESIPDNDILKATKREYKDEVHYIILQGCDSAKAENVKRANNMLDILAKQYQRPYISRPNWNALSVKDFPKYYARYCLRMGQIFTPEQIDQIDYFPSYEYLEGRRHVAFDELLDGVGDLLTKAAPWQLKQQSYLKLADSFVQFNTLRQVRKIMDELQAEIDSLVQTELKEIQRKAAYKHRSEMRHIHRKQWLDEVAHQAQAECHDCTTKQKPLGNCNPDDDPAKQSYVHTDDKYNATRTSTGYATSSSKCKKVKAKTFISRIFDLAEELLLDLADSLLS